MVLQEVLEAKPEPTTYQVLKTLVEKNAVSFLAISNLQWVLVMIGVNMAYMKVRSQEILWGWDQEDDISLRIKEFQGLL